jgi:hypothetical protein
MEAGVNHFALDVQVPMSVPRRLFAWVSSIDSKCKLVQPPVAGLDHIGVVEVLRCFCRQPFGGVDPPILAGITSRKPASYSLPRSSTGLGSD